MRTSVLCEFLGTAGLLVVVVGSGIMGETVSQGNLGLALLANSLATAAGLYVLIQVFGSLSGAHFNPAVSLMALMEGKIRGTQALFYVLAQSLGAVLGVIVSHLMFGLEVVQVSTKPRSEPRLYFSEVIATVGLLLTISLLSKQNKQSQIPSAVALYIGAAYWFTSSTSFANPAVTMARAFTDSFAGIEPRALPGFIAAQFFGLALVLGVSKILRNPLQSH